VACPRYLLLGLYYSLYILATLWKPPTNTVLYADDINLHISGKKHEILEKTVNHELKKIDHWVRANKLCINYSKSNVMLMNNHKNINFLVSINHHPISKQSSLKYLGVILDDKLNWKPQIEKLVTQQRWLDSGFLLSDPILFLKNDIHIQSQSCFG